MDTIYLPGQRERGASIPEDSPYSNNYGNFSTHDNETFSDSVTSRLGEERRSGRFKLIT